jgi:hypothetical protein
MRTSRLPLLATVVALLFSSFVTIARAEPTANPAPAGETVYVTVEHTDYIQFNDLRYALTTGDDLFMTTLKASAAAQATFASYAGTVVVLDENVKPPSGATVLRLTWTPKVVSADVTQGGKNKYLGVVNSQPISYHPDYMNMKRSIDSAGLPDARRDAALRADLQMYLFKALQYFVRYQKNS